MRGVEQHFRLKSNCCFSCDFYIIICFKHRDLQFAKSAGLSPAVQIVPLETVVSAHNLSAMLVRVAAARFQNDPVCVVERYLDLVQYLPLVRNTAFIRILSLSTRPDGVLPLPPIVAVFEEANVSLTVYKYTHTRMIKHIIKYD